MVEFDFAVSTSPSAMNWSQRTDGLSFLYLSEIPATTSVEAEHFLLLPSFMTGVTLIHNSRLSPTVTLNSSLQLVIDFTILVRIGQSQQTRHHDCRTLLSQRASHTSLSSSHLTGALSGRVCALLCSGWQHHQLLRPSRPCSQSRSRRCARWCASRHHVDLRLHAVGGWQSSLLRSRQCSESVALGGAEHSRRSGAADQLNIRPSSRHLQSDAGSEMAVRAVGAAHSGAGGQRGGLHWVTAAITRGSVAQPERL